MIIRSHACQSHQPFGPFKYPGYGDLKGKYGELPGSFSCFPSDDALCTNSGLIWIPQNSGD